VTHFEREIREQPEVLERLLADGTLPEVAAALRSREVTLVVTLARGSSDNAVAFFAYLAGQVLGLPVASLPPSLLTVYTSRMKLHSALAIGVSQSGESSDVVAGLRALGAAGATTVAVSNQMESSLQEAADYALYQHAGEERAVAASKTFTSQMMALALLVAHWGEDGALLQALQGVPELMRALLEDPSAAEGAAARLTHARSAYVLGRGLSYGPALEAALKLKETSYLHAQAYSSAEFQHGPIAAVSPSDPVLMLGLDDGTLDSNLEVGKRLRDLGADLTVMSGAAALREVASAAVPLPGGLHGAAEAFLHVLVGQLLALHVTLAKGLDPDAPRHLSKVTKTM